MISVCMATYNGARFIKQQIDSILSQLSENDELVISDDESTDGTIDIINSYNDERIKLFHHKKHILNGMYYKFRYVTENFENALSQAKGDFLFLSDQDDVWLHNKVNCCLTLLRKFDCVVHNYQRINIEGIVLDEQAFKTNPIRNSLVGNVLDNHFRGCCLAFKRDLLKYVLPIPKRVIGHDYWIGALASHYFHVCYEMAPLIQSRHYPNSVSAERKTSFWYKLRYRIDFLVALLGRLIIHI